MLPKSISSKINFKKKQAIALMKSSIGFNIPDMTLKKHLEAFETCKEKDFRDECIKWQEEHVHTVSSIPIKIRNPAIPIEGYFVDNHIHTLSTNT